MKITIALLVLAQAASGFNWWNANRRANSWKRMALNSVDVSNECIDDLSHINAELKKICDKEKATAKKLKGVAHG